MVDGPASPDALVLLGACVRAWQRRGARYVNLPWSVPLSFTQATKPAGLRDFMLPTGGSLVASGEQSFLYLQALRRLPPEGLLCIGWTPCFRDENPDEWHRTDFLKAELFQNVADLDHGLECLHATVRQQLEIFEQLSRKVLREPSAQTAFTVETTGECQCDILCAGIEVGSYGLRPHADGLYLYATALALPRFERAVQESLDPG